jgi:hypothetical protein
VPHELDGLVRRLLERDRAPAGALAHEVVQPLDDLLDLEGARLDEREALVRLRARLGLTQKETGQRQNGEEWIVDLVRRARRKLAHDGQPATLHHAHERAGADRRVHGKGRRVLGHAHRVGSASPVRDPRTGASLLTRNGEGYDAPDAR